MSLNQIWLNLFEATSESLNVIAEGIEDLNLEVFTFAFLENFFLACSNLYPHSELGFERVTEDRYFIKYTVIKLDRESVSSC